MKTMKKKLLSKCHWRTQTGARLLVAMAILPLASFAAEKSTSAKPNGAVFFVQQQITVKGTVVDSKGLPLVGVSIKAKNATGAALTNSNGEFTINLQNQNSILVFSMIGFKPVEVVASNNMKVVLADEVSELDDVVVIGYGTVKKRDLTGAVVSVKPDQITARPGPNPMESLQGRVAGLDITRTSGQAGEGVTLQLRGNRSIGANSLPLFIINGLPGDYATLNPYDIESIDVLKDAASTATYGAAGANGVIIITTKSGKAGKLNIDFNSYYGYNGWSVVPDALSKDQYLAAKREIYKYNFDGATRKWVTTAVAAANGFPAAAQPLWQSPADDEKVFGPERYKLFNEGNFVNWADIFMRDKPVLQNYSLAASGGTDATKAYVSLNMNNEKGQYIGDDYKLYSTSMRLDHKIRNWLSIGANLQASYVNRDKAQDKLENAIVTDPLVQPYKADGSINPDLGSNVYNLLLDYQPGVYGNVDNNTKVFFNPYIEVRPIKGLSILSRAGVRMDYSNTYRFDGVGSVNYTYVNANTARARVNQNRYQEYQWENVLTYNYLLGTDHDFTFTGVTSYLHKQWTETEMNQSNIANNNFKWYRFSGDVNTTATSAYRMQKTLGLLGRLTYAYKGKYLLSASVRRDGASVLYKTNQWDTFPAVSAGWRVSDEKFMEGTKKYINNLKVRATWGVAGTAFIPPNSSANFVEQTNMALGGELVPIYRSSQFITNPDLSWEKSKTLNLGLDLGMFNNRIDMALDYYNTNTDGVIYNVSSPILNGAYRSGSTPYQTYLNVAKTNNKGFEVSMNTRNIVSKNFEWSSSVAFARNNEKILKLIGGTANNITNNVAAGENRTPGNYVLSIGEPIASFRNFKIDGIWQIGEEIDAAAFGRRPGDIKVNTPGIVKLADGVFKREGTDLYYYTNLADAQKFNPALTAASSTYLYNNTNDYQTIGHNTPDFTLGFQNSFKYKNFDLGIYSFVRWGQTINYVMMGWYNPGSLATVASPPRTMLANFNYWTPENPSNDFPVMNIQTGTSMLGFSGLNYVDGSFFKIKNITLGYTLPQNIAKKVAMRSVRFYSTITNPLVITKSHLLKDYDPEMNGEMDYPLTKQLVFGLNVSF
ncbi:SusC/RagA family TonB-linked outer membrane protein [Pedobacter heparinus]|uniref:TonB-dependent receptor plug n=1 Tax=Pedobacter heparinus (strain ATCC 13125 / DSM 2366 / CIP 104194 / JCM 7457 / NBRC 12017 / NCIMB 9290 / NRRL B-14731 / HIM 762-3) TaxID=485917 RepID=C6XSD0_PEDHD|nr:TonB-dependent receptor [Pedobacter heparinus]ACU03475.1 TonB-dependent receptor plug [Pedobacter heparinus DSM 2366]